jgi:hypothetical protein
LVLSSCLVNIICSFCRFFFSKIHQWWSLNEKRRRAEWFLITNTGRKGSIFNPACNIIYIYIYIKLQSDDTDFLSVEFPFHMKTLLPPNLLGPPFSFHILMKLWLLIMQIRGHAFKTLLYIYMSSVSLHAHLLHQFHFSWSCAF